MMISSLFEEGGCTIESWTGSDLAGASLSFVSGSWNEHALQNVCYTEQICEIIWTIAMQLDFKLQHFPVRQLPGSDTIEKLLLL